MNEIYEYNLSAGGLADIIASKTFVMQATGIGSDKWKHHQLAPDGKIYVARANKPYLSCIENPNELYPACNFIDSAIYLGGQYSSWGLPNFIVKYEYNNIDDSCSLNIEIESNNLICTGECIGSASIYVNNGQSPYSYVWSNSETTQTITNLCGGIYSVTVTDALGNSTADSVTIIDGVDMPVTITQNGDTLSAINAPNYQWYYNDTLIPGATDQTYIITESGYYYVTTTSSNCTFTSNTIETTCICVSIDENDLSKQLFINPNPCDNFLNLQSNISFTLKYFAFDISGRLMQNGFFTESKAIDVSGFANGIYLLTLQSAEHSTTVKVVVQH